MRKIIGKLCVLLIALTMILPYTEVFAVETNSVSLNKIELNYDKVVKGNEIYVNLNITNVENVESIKAYFFCQTDPTNYPSAYLKEFNTSHPYFETTDVGFQAGNKYQMTIIEVTDKSGNVENYVTVNNNENKLVETNGKYLIDIINPTTITNYTLTEKNTTLLLSDTLHFGIDTSEPVDYISIWFKNDKNSSFYTEVTPNNLAVTVSSIYISGGSMLYSGEYYISDIFLNPTNAAKIVHYSVEPDTAYTLELERNTFTIDNITSTEANSIDNYINKDENLWFSTMNYNSVSEITITNKANGLGTFIGCVIGSDVSSVSKDSEIYKITENKQAKKFNKTEANSLLNGSIGTTIDKLNGYSSFAKETIVNNNNEEFYVVTKDALSKIPNSYQINKIEKLKNGNYKVKVSYLTNNNSLSDDVYNTVVLKKVGSSYNFVSCSSNYTIETGNNIKKSSTTTADKTTATGNIPQTGEITTIVTIILITILTGASFFFMKYKKMDK